MQYVIYIYTIYIYIICICIVNNQFSICPSLTQRLSGVSTDPWQTKFHGIEELQKKNQLTEMRSMLVWYVVVCVTCTFSKSNKMLEKKGSIIIVISLLVSSLILFLFLSVYCVRRIGTSKWISNDKFGPGVKIAPYYQRKREYSIFQISIDIFSNKKGSSHSIRSGRMNVAKGYRERLSSIY